MKNNVTILIPAYNPIEALEELVKDLKEKWIHENNSSK